MKSVAVLDSGNGNIQSVIRAYASFGCIVSVLEEAPVVDNFDYIVLPGIGSAGSVADKLKKRFGSWIMDRALMNQPIIGICLGYQLMCQGTDESGGIEGLGLFPFKCIALEAFEDVPLRVGWYRVSTNGIGHEKRQKYFYFNHAYGVKLSKLVASKKEVIGSGVNKSVAWMRNGSAIGIQFHPEKSQLAGKSLVRKMIDSI